MCEDIDMETPTAGSSLDFEGSPGEDSKRLDDDPISAYTGNVGLYTARDLSKPKDVLAAFYGVSKLRCNALGGDSLFGLPTSHFDWTLLWEPEDAPQRRSEIELVGERRIIGKILPFPSWSWCGWDGWRIQYEPHIVEECSGHLHNWLMSHTWITWYIRDGNGNLRLVWNPVSRDKATMSDAQWRGYRANENVSSFYEHYGRKLPQALVGLRRDSFDKSIPEFPVQVRTSEPGQNSSISLHRPDHPLLQFWTWSAYFYLEPLSRRQPGVAGNSRHMFSRRYDVLDASRNWASSVVFNPAWQFDIRQPQQFIAISDARSFWRDVESPLDNNYSGRKTTWRLYNVLLLRYDEENKESRLIASRVALGKIYHDAFDHACKPPGDPSRRPMPKSWEEIILG